MSVSASASLPPAYSPLAQHIVYSPEVLQAIKDGRPVVGLESTIISHGMPYPQNRIV